jgi:hypothetical protein
VGAAPYEVGGKTEQLKKALGCGKIAKTARRLFK